MKLKNLSKIAEIIGSAGIIISLLYASIQFKENSKAIRSSNANQIISSITTWYSELANNEQSSKIYYQFFIDPKILSPEERFQCVLNLHALILNFQNAYYFDKDGTIDSRINKSIASIMKAAKDSKGFKYYWDMRKESFAPEFVSYVNTFLEDKTIETKMNEIYERDDDLNKIIKNSDN